MNDSSTPLLPGTQAPDFSLPRTHFESFALSDLHGRPAALVFYPGDWEPVTRQQLALYQEYLPELRRFGAALIGISADSVWSHTAFGQALDLSFPLLADFHPKGEVSRSYGVYLEDEGHSSRAVVVLDGTGIVCWTHVYPTNLNPGVDGMLTALETMQPKKPTDYQYQARPREQKGGGR
jgi:peroxiredoxin